MQQKNRKQQIREHYRWVVFLTVAFAYFLIFSQRTAPGVISDQLMQEFHIAASTLGLLTGIQFFAYMCLQIPLGMGADRFGPARFLLAGTLLDGLGTIVFSLSPNEAVIMAARLAVGVGDAMIWVNIVLVLSRWFRAEQFASMLGWTGTSGSLGAIATSVPLTWWISAQGWRIPFFSLGAALCMVSAIIYMVLIRYPKRLHLHPVHAGAAPEEGRKKEKAGDVLKRMVRNRQAWATFLGHFGLVGTYIGFIGSWAVPYSMSVYGMSRASASGLVSLGLIGAIIGGPVTGLVSDRWKTRKLPYLILHLMAFVCWTVLIISGGHPPLVLLAVLYFLIGIANGGSFLTFAVVRESFPATEVGVATGFANTGGFLSAVTLPALIGLVLDHFGVQSNSIATHTVITGYQYSFIVPACFTLLGMIGGLTVLEKRTKQKVKVPSLSAGLRMIIHK